MEKKYRIGIDVGGTFTHAVAVNAFTLEIVATTKVPTTHRSREGVAQGVIESMMKLLEEGNIDPEEIMLIAHSTTQATNALLEGDVSPVGIVGMGQPGVEGRLAQANSRIGNLELAPGKYLKTYYRFLPLDDSFTIENVRNAIEELKKEGAEVIVAASAFSVDDSRAEELVMEEARKMGLPSTATCHISQLYGLKVRTRTAAINASMLLKMIETADMTEYSINKAGIKSPLMIMRSDGGIMDIEQMRKRPILTMLSGPAAGVAAALKYVRISDGIFLEVGGTSTDITAIKNGKALIKTAQIGKYKVYIRTLDVRTVGVAGGSMIREDKGQIQAVGPRSAHIAGYKYCAFSDKDEKVADISSVAPLKDDPRDYVVVNGKKDKYALTTTCVSNFMGFIQDGDYAAGNLSFISESMKKFAEKCSVKVSDLAQNIMEVAVKPVRRVVSSLLDDYELDMELLTLTGGGGGAKALVPFTGKMMHLPVEVAENAEVISAIGAALAMIRETIEKTVIEPSPQDILKIKREASESVMQMGALPDTIEVQIEIESQKNILRAIATGSTEFRTDQNIDKDVNWEDVQKQVAQSMRVDPEKVSQVGETHFLKVYQSRMMQKKFFGLIKLEKFPIRIVDIEGIIRLQLTNAAVCSSEKVNFKDALIKLVRENVIYGDAGEEIPDVFLLYRRNISDFQGLTSMEQLTAVVDSEIEKLTDDETLIGVLDLSYR